MGPPADDLVLLSVRNYLVNSLEIVRAQRNGFFRRKVVLGIAADTDNEGSAEHQAHRPAHAGENAVSRSTGCRVAGLLVC